MAAGSHLKKLCRKCGQWICSCTLSAAIIASAALPHITHPSVLTPGVIMSQAEQPHPEQRIDTRQVREFPKTSAATASPAGIFYRVYAPDAPRGTPPRFSGFSPDATDTTGEVTDIQLA